ncbi:MULTISPECIES: RloB family protein, partial [unclassified Microbispora]|uniref:RloB family protein n=1 Tax=unclassified Microbispora TaxID=2614687 RepID=UPI00197BC5EC
IEHPTLQRALELAKKKGIKCAVSNPCFELWLILHCWDQRAYLTTDRACSLLEEQGSCCYKRDGKSFDAVSLLGKYEVARKRAQMLEDAHRGETRWADRNPFASVWQLVDLLRAQVGGSTYPAR